MKALLMKAAFPRFLVATATTMVIITSLWVATPSFGLQRRAVITSRGTESCIVPTLRSSVTTAVRTLDIRFGVSEIKRAFDYQTGLTYGGHVNQELLLQYRRPTNIGAPYTTTGINDIRSCPVNI